MNSATSTDPGLRPWQLFLLAGMLAATAVVLVSTGQTTSSVVVLSLTVVASSLVAIAGYRSLAPLVSAEDLDEGPVGGRMRGALEREKALLLRTIKELEFDHAMGKTATAEFEEMRGRLKVRAVGLMRRIEGGDYRAVIEEELTRRSGAAVVPAATTDAPSAAATVPAATAAAGPCATCGGLNDLDARFCKHCGASIGAVLA